MDKSRQEFYEIMKTELSTKNREIFTALVESLQIPQESIDDDYYDWNRHNGFKFVMVGKDDSIDFNIRYSNPDEVCFYITYCVKKHTEIERKSIYDVPQWEITKATYNNIYRFDWYMHADESFQPSLRYKEIAESILQNI